MPRDDWDNLRRKEVGRRAILTGEYERPIKSQKKARRIKKRGERASFQAAQMCHRCKIEADVKKEVTFKDGTHHVGLYCGKCKRWVKWLGMV